MVFQNQKERKFLLKIIIFYLISIFSRSPSLTTYLTTFLILIRVACDSYKVAKYYIEKIDIILRNLDKSATSERFVDLRKLKSLGIRKLCATYVQIVFLIGVGFKVCDVPVIREERHAPMHIFIRFFFRSYFNDLDKSYQRQKGLYCNSVSSKESLMKTTVNIFLFIMYRFNLEKSKTPIEYRHRPYVPSLLNPQRPEFARY
ncbi:8079_t:CDS:2, partial [Acaulospora morrowiae]